MVALMERLGVWEQQKAELTNLGRIVVVLSLSGTLLAMFCGAMAWEDGVTEDMIGEPSKEVVVASGSPTMVEMADSGGLDCIAYAGMAAHQETHDARKVSIIVDGGAFGVGAAGACARGTRGTVRTWTWIGWRSRTREAAGAKD